MKKVLLIIAHHGFQPREYEKPKKVLTVAGVRVETASDQAGVAVSSITHEQVKVDVTLENVEAADYDGIFLIGGPGALEHLDNEKTYQIIRQAVQAGKAFGAICISPRILAKAGVLKDKKATGWNNDDQLAAILARAGAEYVCEPVVSDGKLVTAWGPDAAEEFGQEILKAI